MNKSELRYFEYRYDDAAPGHTHAYLWPTIERTLQGLNPTNAIDVGCGAGDLTSRIAGLTPVVGIDASQSGIAAARRTYPNIRFETASVYDDLASTFGRFDTVISLEVVEHLFNPRSFATTLFSLTRPCGHVVISTPYHGYWKNVALALSGRMDAHYTALWDGGHIKFWSVRTLSQLLEEAGFRNLKFAFAGRVRWLAKSMIVTANRPDC